MSDAYRMATKNVILLKDDVGRAKKSVYDLPHEGHAYGRSEIPDLEGAREVTMHWAAHVPHPKPESGIQDFKRLNKEAAKSQVKNARELVEFRKAGADFKLTPPGPTGCLPKVIPSDVIPSFAYGRKSRPSTPIGSVVGGGYAAEFEEAANAQYEMRALASGPPGKTKIKLTKASGARISNARERRRIVEENVAPTPPWTMKKFQNVPGKMSLPPLTKSASAPTLTTQAVLS
mmetsp:Transcript_15120/g.31659  ORF Transcript_15120/g.31659 Transcript_15120/m.31659 type:complete len:232 (-) Transcript_15120:66-761(-)